jgi:MFS family permease
MSARETPAAAPTPSPAATAAVGPDTSTAPITLLSGANLAAQAAEQISLAAVPMVAVLMLAAGPRETGLLAAAQSLPFLLLALPFGLWADRASRRHLMMGAEALRVLAMALLAVLAFWAGGAALSLPVLALLGFAAAVGTVAFSVAAPAMVPLLVPRAELARANGRLELARSLAFAGGPALAGAIVAAAGGGGAFVLAAALSAVAAGLLWRLPADAPGAVVKGSDPSPQAHAAPPAGKMASPRAGALTHRPLRNAAMQLRDGARYVWRNRWLRPVLLTAVVWNLSWMVLQAVYVPHAMQHLGLDARGVGLTLSLYGAGMVLGALAASRLMRRQPLGMALGLGPLVSVVAALTMAATLWWPHASLAALSFFLFGAGPIVWTVSSTTLRQTLTPAAMLGRVSSIFLTANAGARPLGALLAAGVAAALADGEQANAACLLLAAFGFVLQAGLILLSAVCTLKVLPPQSTA